MKKGDGGGMQASLQGQHETLIFWQRNLATKLDQSFKHNFFELES